MEVITNGCPSEYIDGLIEDYQKETSEQFGLIIDESVVNSFANIFALFSLIFRYPNVDVVNKIKESTDSYKDFFNEYLKKGLIIDSTQDDLEVEYVKLFIANLGGIPAPLYASLYKKESNNALMTDSVMTLRSVMAENGYRLNENINEIDDNLYVICEYVSHLFTECKKCGSDDVKVLKAISAMEVIREFLFPMIDSFYEKVSKHSQISFYSDAALLLKYFLYDFDCIVSDFFEIKYM